MNAQSRDIVLLGLFFVALGVVAALVNAAKATAQPTLDKRLEFFRQYRDEFIRQENEA